MVPLEYALQCEVAHWLFSLCLAVAVFSLTWLIYGENVTYQLRLLGASAASFSACFSMHYILDWVQWGW